MPSPKAPAKKRKGFSVGPANLPDGAHRRKVAKIKKSLIHKAKVKKQYSKEVSRELPSEDPNAIRARRLFEEAEKERLERAAQDHSTHQKPTAEERSLAPVIHPDRQAALDNEEPKESITTSASTRRNRRRMKKPSSYKKEQAYAARLKVQREEAARRAEEMRKEKERKQKERQQRGKVMSSKTRNGQFKLGKMSHILLNRIQEQMEKE